MSLKRYLILPVIIACVGGIYWFFSYEPAGTAMILVFSGAMAVMGWILLPTLDNVGPTAPVDPDFEQSPR
jgi:hypothetical protein